MRICLTYARKTAAKAAAPIRAMELPKELAAPLNGVMGEVTGLVLRALHFY